MEAAANGKSTLGIPKTVGQEFVRADAASKAYAGTRDKSAAPVRSARTPRAPKLPAHPGEVDLPRMHTSKHN